MGEWARWRREQRARDLTMCLRIDGRKLATGDGRRVFLIGECVLVYGCLADWRECDFGEKVGGVWFGKE